MILHDHHRHAVEAAVTSFFAYVVHLATPCGGSESAFDLLERWVHLVGGIGAALAGFASAAWYIYSFLALRRQRKKDK